MKALSAETVLALHGLHLMLRTRGPVSSTQISRSGTFASSQVRRVLGKLQSGGLVRSGSGHGFELAKAPGEISILDVIRAVDVPEPPTAPCGGDYDACVTRATCVLAPLCRKTEEAVQESLRAFTLADLDDVSIDVPNCLDPKLRTGAS